MPPVNGYNHATVAPGPLGEQTVTAVKRLTKGQEHREPGPMHKPRRTLTRRMSPSTDIPMSPDMGVVCRQNVSGFCHWIPMVLP